MRTDRRSLRQLRAPHRDSEPSALGVAVARVAGRRRAAPLMLALASLTSYAVIAEEVVADGRTRVDLAVERWAHEMVSPWLTTLMDGVTAFGSTSVVVVLYVGMSVWLGLRKRVGEGIVLIVVAGGGHALVQVLKRLSERARPDLFLPAVEAHGYSFPSGHTFAATVAFGMMATLVVGGVGRRWRMVAWGMVAMIVVAVGMSRIYLGAHYLTDVMGSVVLGTAWLMLWSGARRLAVAGRSDPPIDVTFLSR